MTTPTIPDVITIVGSSYFQPITDLVERLLKRPYPQLGLAGAGDWENGYSVAITVLLVAVLESFTSRLRFVRKDETKISNKPIAEVLNIYFNDLPNPEELIEVFLLRNIVIHNHVWHIDTSTFPETSTLLTPGQIGFQTNKNYDSYVNIETKRTRILGLHASPTSVDRTDVAKAFEVVWCTLWFMHTKNYQHTPLAGRTVHFRGNFIQFEKLVEFLRVEGGERDS
ncbi:hypothetical protein [Undibacterium sp. CY21W]|uniref:hypothetical protein n=1 Tax=Undibacterium sp. CY21W TaxID=2762293 RepID=UPI00164BE4ED|nr:hypothetical protein [Undibacterium sp. CY21W]MBC3926760.1 hypothetical protein [Undibacterium sp. CY21W]